MKNKSTFKLPAMLIAGIFCAYNAQGQTYGAGNMGANCGVGTSGGNNVVFVGCSAGAANTATGGNTFIGNSAGNANTLGRNNVFVGWHPAVLNTTAHYNVAVGDEALATQSYSVAVGFDSYNVAVGYRALYSNAPSSTTTGIKNTALGHKAGYSNSTGIENVFSGYEAGFNNTTGSSNTFIGHQADLVSSTQRTYAAAIGYNAKVDQNNSLVLGGTGTYSVSVGIGTTTPSALLHLVNNANAQTKMFVENTSTGGSAFSGVQLKNSTGSSYIYMTSTGYSAPDVANALYIQNNNSGPTIFYGNTSGESMRITSGGYVGIGTGTVTPGYILTVKGQPGCSVNTVFTNYSDSTLKTNISDIDSCLKKIMKLRPVQFNYNKEFLTLWNDTINPNDDIELQRVHKGFIAQEVKQIFPEMVGIDSSHGKAYCDLNLSNMFVYLVKGMQEQQKIIDSLFVMVNAKGGQRTENTSGSGNNTIETDVTLANKNIVLDQNSPNPFHDQTTINYEIKTDFINAAIMFTNISGEIIKEVPITEKGKGQLNVFAQDLTTGIYTYYIVVDGKTIYAKKMVKE